MNLKILTFFILIIIFYPITVYATHDYYPITHSGPKILQGDHMIQKLLDDGVESFTLQKYDKSLIYFDAVLEIDDVNIQALQYKGYIYEINDYPVSSFQFFYHIYQIDPTNIDAISNMAFQILELDPPNRKTELALIFFDTALRIDPEYNKALVGKGIALSLLGRFDESDSFLQSAQQNNPDDLYAIIGIAEKEFLQGNFQKSNMIFDLILQTNPNNIDALVGIAKSNLQLAVENSKTKQILDEKNFNRTIDTLRKVISLNENSLEVQFLMGESYYQIAKFNSETLGTFDTENYKQALLYFEEIVSTKPTNVNLLLKMGDLYHNMGDYEKAISYYDRILKINPTHGFAKIGIESSINKISDSNGFIFYLYSDLIWYIGMVILLIFGSILFFKTRVYLLKTNL